MKICEPDKLKIFNICNLRRCTILCNACSVYPGIAPRCISIVFAWALLLNSKNYKSKEDCHQGGLKHNLRQESLAALCVMTPIYFFHISIFPILANFFSTCTTTCIGSMNFRSSEPDDYSAIFSVFNKCVYTFYSLLNVVSQFRDGWKTTALKGQFDIYENFIAIVTLIQ